MFLSFTVSCRSFSNFQYFDSKGMFISLVFSIPLLLNAVIIVVCLPLVLGIYDFFFLKKKKNQTLPLQYTLTDGVGVQDLFHYDWAEDPSAEEKGPQREEREEWLIRLCMSINGLHLEEFGHSDLLIPNFGNGKSVPSYDLKRIFSLMSVNLRNGCLFCFLAVTVKNLCTLWHFWRSRTLSVLYLTCESMLKCTPSPQKDYRFNCPGVCYPKCSFCSFFDYQYISHLHH